MRDEKANRREPVGNNPSPPTPLPLAGEGSYEEYAPTARQPR